MMKRKLSKQKSEDAYDTEAKYKRMKDMLATEDDQQGQTYSLKEQRQEAKQKFLECVDRENDLRLKEEFADKVKKVIK